MGKYQPTIHIKKGRVRYFINVMYGSEVMLTSQKYYSHMNANRAAKKFASRTGFKVVD
jgi:hypothetical protein